MERTIQTICNEFKTARYNAGYYDCRVRHDPRSIHYQREYGYWQSMVGMLWRIVETLPAAQQDEFYAAGVTAFRQGVEAARIAFAQQEGDQA